MDELAGQAVYSIGGKVSGDPFEIEFYCSDGAPTVKTSDDKKYKVQVMEIGYSDEQEHAWAVLRKSGLIS